MRGGFTNMLKTIIIMKYIENRPTTIKRQGATTPTAQVSFRRAIVSL